MENSTWKTRLLPLLITFVVVKLVHHLAGFDYDIFLEGVFTVRFLLDIGTWVAVYVVVSFLLKKVFPSKEATDK
ncbi:hypothetical protein [Rufibacter sp. XAAS-G3-1]|uniref:hypothetical protein n=1 Tax=Rufibacter sp. XAAS-G3-1 TaxID=2729134 RepID=UPI0015E6F8D4|nr:hypothetical protein [Rufibacter sp. XAAS-G3-1]